ncbi:MAG: formylmethanofuran dehydrogenase subunit B [Gammaproteobacteria bacterium]
MANKSQTHKDVVCPFCSLLCDDLIVEERDAHLTVLENGCGKSRRGFESTSRHGGPMLRGQPVAIDEAVNKAAALLKKSRRPLISGLGCDVAGSRAAMLLAEQAGAVIDHGQSDAAVHNLLALQEGGWIMTTLTELKNRADFVLFLGTDTVNNYPRFFERYIWNESSLFLQGKTPRKLAYLGHRLDTRPGIPPSGKKPLSINCDSEALIDYVTLLTAMLRDKDFKSEFVSAQKQNKLQKLAEEMKQARYGVIVWSPGEVSIEHGELLVQSISDLIRYLNRRGRFAGLSLGGDNGGASFTNVCAWQTGYPLRVDYGGGAPRYNAWRHSTRHMLSGGLADTLLWISAYESQPERPKTSIATIVLSCIADETAEVYIPVGTPGLDHPGNLFRTDSVVNLPLKSLRSPAAPDAADILSRISGALTS